MTAPSASRTAAPALDARGVALVAGSAVVWSFGGALARAIGIDDTWTVVFWRSLFASAFLLAFLLVRDGRAGLGLFREMGWPGLAVGICFAGASIGFVMAIQFTTVANVILIGAGVPLVAALIGRIVYATPVTGPTWAAIALVLAGVAIMVTGPGEVGGSAVGNGLACLVALFFAGAVVITRQYAGIRMTPAVCTGTALAALLAAVNAGSFAVGPGDLALLFCFGALNLGLGMALFVTGARLIPAALTALLGTLETVLQPIWVWLVHGEVPSGRTLVGGALVLVALFGHILLEARRARVHPATPPVPPGP